VVYTKGAYLPPASRKLKGFFPVNYTKETSWCPPMQGDGQDEREAAQAGPPEYAEAMEKNNGNQSDAPAAPEELKSPSKKHFFLSPLAPAVAKDSEAASSNAANLRSAPSAGNSTSNSATSQSLSDVAGTVDPAPPADLLRVSNSKKIKGEREKRTGHRRQATIDGGGPVTQRGEPQEEARAAQRRQTRRRICIRLFSPSLFRAIREGVGVGRSTRLLEDDVQAGG